MYGNLGVLSRLSAAGALTVLKTFVPMTIFNFSEEFVLLYFWSDVI